MAYSSGFNPHPRISYAGAAPTGAASEAESLEIGLAPPLDPAAVAASLGESLPDGLDVVEVVESPGGPFAELLEASHWLVDLAVPPIEAGSAVTRFLEAESVLVQRMTKKGLREFDCRAAVVSLSVRPQETGSRLDLVLRHAVPAVRPDDVLSGLAATSGLDVGSAPLLTRVAQGPLDAAAGTVGDPLHPSV